MTVINSSYCVLETQRCAGYRGSAAGDQLLPVVTWPKVSASILAVVYRVGYKRFQLHMSSYCRIHQIEREDRGYAWVCHACQSEQNLYDEAQSQTQHLAELAEVAKAQAASRKDEGGCDYCGQRFLESKRRFPVPGKSWTGILGRHSSVGVCPACYHHRLEKGEEKDWSREEWRSYFKEESEAIETVEDAENLRDLLSEQGEELLAVEAGRLVITQLERLEQGFLSDLRKADEKSEQWAAVLKKWKKGHPSIETRCHDSWQKAKLKIDAMTRYEQELGRRKKEEEERRRLIEEQRIERQKKEEEEERSRCKSLSTQIASTHSIKDLDALLRLNAELIARQPTLLNQAGNQRSTVKHRVFMDRIFLSGVALLFSILVGLLIVTSSRRTSMCPPNPEQAQDGVVS